MWGEAKNALYSLSSKEKKKRKRQSLAGAEKAGGGNQTKVLLNSIIRTQLAKTSTVCMTEFAHQTPLEALSIQ